MFWGEIYVSVVGFLQNIAKKGTSASYKVKPKATFFTMTYFLFTNETHLLFFSIKHWKFIFDRNWKPCSSSQNQSLWIFWYPFLQIWILWQTEMDPVLNIVLQLIIFMSNMYWHLTTHICMWIGVCQIASKDRT